MRSLISLSALFALLIACSPKITTNQLPLATHPKTASAIFEQVSPSVVVIVTYGAEGKSTGLGSGVVVSNDVIATNCHVIQGAIKTEIIHKGKQYPATVLHSDWDRDLCTLSVSNLKAPAVVKGSTSRLKVGARVYAIGAPRGLELTLSEGIVSSLRPVDGGQYLQITAPISQGSSGGGLFDENAQLIGLPTFYLADGQQLNFAVPVEWINELPMRNMKQQETSATFVDWINRALALQEKNDWQEAIHHAERWTQVMPKSLSAWFHLAVAYYESGQTAKAIDAYQQTLGIDPDVSEIWYNLGNAYLTSGQNSKAIEAYQQAVRIDPEQYMAWSNLGVAYGKSGQTGKEIEAYEQAQSIVPENATIWYNLGNAYLTYGQSSKAIEAYQRTVGIDQKHSRAWCNLGIAYGKSGQNSKAIEAYQQALRIDSEDSITWYNLGIAYGKSGQNSKAIEAYQQALRIDSEDSITWYSLGIAYRQSGQTGKLTEVYKRLMTIDPVMAEEFFKKAVLP